MKQKFRVKDAEIIRTEVQQKILRSEEPLYDHRLSGILPGFRGLS